MQTEQPSSKPGVKHRASQPLPATPRTGPAGVHRAGRVTDRLVAGVLLLTLLVLAGYLVVR